MAERQRGSIPEPALHERDPDTEVLDFGEHGPYRRGQVPPRFSFEQMHPSLQEILVRMDRDEVALFNEGVKIITSLDKKDIDRFRLSLKLFGVVLMIYKGAKWSLIAFLGGLGAVSIAGDQIQKLAGWGIKLIAMFSGAGK